MLNDESQATPNPAQVAERPLGKERAVELEQLFSRIRSGVGYNSATGAAWEEEA